MHAADYDADHFKVDGFRPEMPKTSIVWMTAVWVNVIAGDFHNYTRRVNLKMIQNGWCAFELVRNAEPRIITN